MTDPPDDYALAELLRNAVNFIAREIANRIEDAIDEKNGFEINAETVHATVEEVLFLWLTNELNNPTE